MNINLKLEEDLVFCNHHGKYCEPIRWCQNEEDEDDEYAYPTTAEINEMRAEYLREKDNQYIKEGIKNMNMMAEYLIGDRREALLEQADFLKTKMREDNTRVDNR